MKTCPVCHYENQNEAQYCAQCGASIQNTGQAMKQIDWFFVEDKSPHGPYSEEEMAAMIQQGRIKPVTFIWQAEYSDWKRLEDSELARYLKKESPAPAKTENPLFSQAQSFASYPTENTTPLSQGQPEPAPAMEAHGQEFYGTNPYPQQNGYAQSQGFTNPGDMNPYATQSFTYESYSSNGQGYGGQSETYYMQSQESYGMQNPQQTYTYGDNPYGEQSQTNDWYYTLNGEIYGPFSQALLNQMVQNGQVTADAYVWKEGMSDWQPLMESTFAMQSPQSAYPSGSAPSYQEYGYEYQQPSAYGQPEMQSVSQQEMQQPAESYMQPQPTETAAEVQEKAPVIFTNLKARSVPLFFTLYCTSGILLGLIWLLAQSFLNLGGDTFLNLMVTLAIALIQIIVLFVWIALMGKNVQTLSQAYLKEAFPSALPAILIGIISFGLYLFYYLWRMEATLCQIRVQDHQVRKTSFLAILLIPVALCILQDQINEIIHWENAQKQEPVMQQDYLHQGYAQQGYVQQGYPQGYGPMH